MIITQKGFKNKPEMLVKIFLKKEKTKERKKI